MKKSKLILLFKSLLVIFLTTILVIKYMSTHSFYNLNTKEITGQIIKIEKTNDTVVFDIKAKEKIRCYYKGAFNYSLGDIVTLKGVLTTGKTNTNFYLFNYQKYLLSQKINYLMEVSRVTLYKVNHSFLFKIKTFLINRCLALKNPYLKTFILGDKSDIDIKANNSYQLNGISHLFSVSGMHISLLTFLLIKLLKPFRLKILFISIFLLVFIFLTNFSPSVLRAASLFILLYINKQLHLGLQVIEILIFIALVLLAYNPYYIYNIGFLFSFIVSLYLILFNKLINNISGKSKYLKQVFVISFIAFLASLPIMINNFHSLNFLSVFLNLVYVPLVTFIVFPLVLITFIINPLIVILNPITQILEVTSIYFSKMTFLTFTFHHLPFCGVIMYYVIITYILYKLSYQKYQFLIILIIVLWVHNNILLFNKYPIIIMQDVNQGDSTIIITPHSTSAVLIDTGGNIGDYSLSHNVIIPTLKAHGIKKIISLIISHGDMDHAKEALTLMDYYKIDNIILNSKSDTPLEKKIINKAQSKKINCLKVIKKKLKINKQTFYIYSNSFATNENENSLIVYTKLNKKNILFMGDAGIESENVFLKEYNLVNVDILKVGHHGSKNSSSLKFINKIKPHISLISAGVNNQFNHPHSEVINILTSVDSKIYQTNKHGMIKLILKDKITVVYNSTLQQ